MIRRVSFSIFLFWIVFLLSHYSYASFPHAPHDLAHSVSCESCHSNALPDTDRSAICDACHDGVIAPAAATHSSTVINGNYSNWGQVCLDCHDPHIQAQLISFANPAFYLATGTIAIGTIVDNGDGTSSFGYTTVSYKPGWDPVADNADWGAKTDTDRGLILVVNKLVDTTEVPDHTFEIKSASDTTVTVIGLLETSLSGRTFGVMYGQLLKSEINTPNSGIRAVKLFDPNGGLVDEIGSPAEGICQVCHTQTQHWSPATPINDDHFATRACSDCHFHTIGFAHGAGGSEGSNCVSCHGHDLGYEYEPGKFSQGAGTSHSHSTHTEMDSDDQIGPNIICAECHDTNNFPFFKSGTDSDGDSKYDLAETDVCDVCHSEGGPFAGVTDPDFGAKNNWKNGVYDANGLAAGKEKWCAGCHDSGISVVLGVSAPNIAGDSSQTWGYYVTGHTGYQCKECHDSNLRHIDGEPRTYAYSGPMTETFVAQPYTIYREGYRLRIIGGDYPLRIPKVLDLEPINETADFKLCFQCHVSANFFNDTPPFATNFNNSGPNQTYGKAYYETNSHRSHLYHVFPDFPEGPYDKHDMWWDSDWNTLTGNPNRGGADSGHSCVTCHNVHGSSYSAMMRDGKLSGRTKANGFEFDGLPFEYLAEDGAMPAVTSGGVDLTNSIGAVIRASSVRNDDTRSFDGTCWMGCHQKKVAPSPAYTTMEEYAYCGLCHAFTFYKENYIGNYGIDYFRVPSTGQ